MSKVGIIGLGYVGLPLALQAAKVGHDVIGVDIDPDKVEAINQGINPFKEKFTSDLFNQGIRFPVTTNYQDLADVSVYVICVPTPVIEGETYPQPDYSCVLDSIASITPYLKKGDVVSLESTVNPGTCDELIIPSLQYLLNTNGNVLNVGDDIGIAHCPERVDPGNEQYTVANIPRNVGINDPKWGEQILQFYNSITTGEVSLRKGLWEAEYSKMDENCFRFIAIARVNEAAMFADTLEKDFLDVIEGASTKPFGYMKFWQSCGIGGHCIPVDPFFLLSYAEEKGYSFDGIKWAYSINSGMPNYAIKRLKQGFMELGVIDAEHDRIPSDTKVALLGLAYKPDIDDARESPSIELFKLLESEGTTFQVFDPFIDSHPEIPSNYFAHSLEESLRGADAVLVATAHKAFLGENGGADLIHQMYEQGIRIIMDGQNSFNMDVCEDLGIIYRGIGRGIY